ncbi:MAG: Uncharacterized MFS-type transporter, partial [uncultured Actinomycetospora sp.]
VVTDRPVHPAGDLPATPAPRLGLLGLGRRVLPGRDHDVRVHRLPDGDRRGGRGQRLLGARDHHRDLGGPRRTGGARVGAAQRRRRQGVRAAASARCPHRSHGRGDGAHGVRDARAVVPAAGARAAGRRHLHLRARPGRVQRAHLPPGAARAHRVGLRLRLGRGLRGRHRPADRLFRALPLGRAGLHVRRARHVRAGDRGDLRGLARGLRAPGPVHAVPLPAAARRRGRRAGERARLLPPPGPAAGAPLPRRPPPARLPRLQRDLPGRAHRGLHLRRRPRGGHVRALAGRRHHLRHRRQRRVRGGRGRGWPAGRPRRPEDRDRRVPRRPRPDRGVHALRVRDHRVLDRRHVPGAVRRTGAGVLAQLPRARRPARARGRAVRALRHHRARGQLPRAGDVRPVHHGLRHPAVGHPRHRARAAARAGDVPARARGTRQRPGGRRRRRCRL